MSSGIFLGIDTGGTYTDAVFYSETQGVLAKAKALTTRHDLAVGIAGAVDAVLSSSSIPVQRISLVSLSTTLATNALVEGQGGRAGLVMIGFGPQDLKRDGLETALGTDPVIFLDGGHNVHGGEKPLDLAPLEQMIDTLKGEVSSFAVAGYFSVRNPAHELKVRDFLHRHSGLPVTCSHELSSKLGGPRRALTTLLNARLISMIDRLIGSCEGFLAQRGIVVPLMVVRGDGALISAAEARLRPIETILSGPAASLIGAHHLTGLDNALVADIGGTTTDVAVLDGGRPRLDEDGAVVGGLRTMVEAVAMRTYGLGGDSEVRFEPGVSVKIQIGPRRVLPLSLASTLFGPAIVGALEQQVKSAHIGRFDGRFAVRTGLPDRYASGLSRNELELYRRIDPVPISLDRLLTMTSQAATLDRLVARGLVHICAITPSDAMHVLGLQSQWDPDAAVLGLRLAARTRSGTGRPIAQDETAIAKLISERLTRQSADALIATALGDDGLANIDPARSELIERALSRKPGILRLAVTLDRPLIGLGASAGLHYPAIGELLSADLVVPREADVANAVGAVVGQIRSLVTVFVTSPEEGRFVVSGAGENTHHHDEPKALEEAERRARASAAQKALASGAVDPVVSVEWEIQAPEIEGRRQLVEARVAAIATGRPSFAERHSFSSGENL